MKRQTLCLLLVVIFLFAAFITPSKSSAKEYYEGKAITVIVGTPPGGGYDLLARLLVRYVSKQIPGNPAIIVQNMPGGDSLVAANHLYRVAKPDGLTIALLNKALPFAQLLKVEGVSFDLTKYVWICSATVESTVLTMRTTLPYKTIYDVMKADKTLFIAGHGPSQFDTQFSEMLVAFLKLNAKVINYKGTPDTVLALERKEIDGTSLAYNSIMPYIERGLVRPVLRSRIAQGGTENLPINEDLTNDTLGKTLMAIHASVGQAGKPFVAPPGTPPEVANILKDAFEKALKDPELEAAAKKSLMDLSYVPPLECVKVVNYILNQPADIVKAFNKYVTF